MSKLIKRMLVSGILLAVAAIVAGCAPKATTKGEEFPLMY